MANIEVEEMKILRSLQEITGGCRFLEGFGQKLPTFLKLFGGLRSGREARL